MLYLFQIFFQEFSLKCKVSKKTSGPPETAFSVLGRPVVGSRKLWCYPSSVRNVAVLCGACTYTVCCGQVAMGTWRMNWLEQDGRKTLETCWVSLKPFLMLQLTLVIASCKSGIVTFVADPVLYLKKTKLTTLFYLFWLCQCKLN